MRERKRRGAENSCRDLNGREWRSSPSHFLPFSSFSHFLYSSVCETLFQGEEKMEKGFLTTVELERTRRMDEKMAE